MHSFSDRLKKIAKTAWRPVLVLAVFALLLKGIDLALYPCTFVRNDIHAISTKQVDDLIVGTSHGKMDIDPDVMEEITGRSGHNACVGGEYGIDVYYLTRLASEKQSPTRLIYEISPGYFVTEKEEGNNYMLFYHEFPLSLSKFSYFFHSISQTSFRSTFFPWYEYDLSEEIPAVPKTISRKISNDYSADGFQTAAQEYHDSGFVERYPVDTSTLPMYEPFLFSEEALIPENMEYLEKTIDFCKENDIEFVAVTTPIPAATLGTYWDNYTDAWDYFSAYFEEKEVPYYNFNDEYYFLFSHEIEDYTDYDGHMNGDAAREFSKVFAELITPSEVQTLG